MRVCVDVIRDVPVAEAAAKFEASGDAFSSGRGGGAASQAALELEDPLERKFRELEGR